MLYDGNGSVIAISGSGSVAKSGLVSPILYETQFMAHGSASWTGIPANTMPRFEKAAQDGYKFVEVDVWFTSDNVPVGSHDDNITAKVKNSDGTDPVEPVIISESTYEELLEIVRRDQFTRFPVYEDTTDNVIGILNAKDLLFQDQEENFSIRTMMRPAYFTYEHKNTSDLFIEMRKSSLSLAIVLDEYGVTAGIITLEDLLEEIVGEIRDEYDTDEVDSIIQIGEYEYEVLGSTNLDDVSQELDADFSSDDYDTLGGLCLELLDHLPEVNEEMYTEDGVLLKIMEVDKNRIEKVYIRLPENGESDLED